MSTKRNRWHPPTEKPRSLRDMVLEIRLPMNEAFDGSNDLFHVIAWYDKDGLGWYTFSHNGSAHPLHASYPNSEVVRWKDVGLP
jgi:hypothetical protein